jgi:hypothetical protein
MVAALTKNLTTVVAKKDGVNLTATGLEANDDSAYDADVYPTSPAFVYRIRCRMTGEDDLLSQRFSPNGGTHTWPAVIFPTDGTWTCTVRDTSDDSEVASLSVVVSTP